MNASQLQLLEVPETTRNDPEPPVKPLTTRQQFALTVVEEAGGDGIYSEEVGAAWCAQRGKHSVQDRCQWCGKNGKQVLDALEKRGLVKYRRARNGVPGAWFTTDNYGAAGARPTSGMLRDDQDIPF